MGCNSIDFELQIVIRKSVTLDLVDEFCGSVMTDSIGDE